ncbi:MAG: hypothetical protein VXZ16_05180 [Bacteroidota bacterium]|nr:hypothetical protein [Bacteroidota bacterium]
MTLSKSHILPLSFPRWAMVFVACAAFQGVGWSQMTVYGDDDDYTYATREGVEFGVNIGVYRGFPLSAYFYDGAGDHQLSDAGSRIWGIQERLQQLQGQQLTHPVTGILNEFPAWNIYSLPLMQYKPSMFFGLKAAKFWNPETALVCHVDVAQVTAEGAWSLSTGLLPDQGQGNEDVRTYPIVGKEQRLNVALGYRTSIYIAEGASWALELGGLANALSVEENYVVMSPNVGNALYEVHLLTAVGNGAGGTLSPASNVLTQWGLGFYTAGGIALEFDEGGHIELNVRASRDNLQLGTETYRGWNVAAFVTWMMPSQLGDFVRASF